MSDLMNISASPHIRDNASVRRIMLDVILALLPAAFYGVYRFGWYSLLILVTCIVSSVIIEALFQKLSGKEITVNDCSAALTGLLIGMNMPPSIPIFIPVIGCAFAIIMAKQIFGGLGHNFMNPALAARCFLLISFAQHMTSFSIDGVSGATPLALLQETGTASKETVINLLTGNVSGTIGETSALLLILGGIYLVIRKVISPVIPLTYIGAFTVFTVLFGGHLGQNDFLLYEFTQLFGGGLMIGAIFMATDYATSPITTKGRIIYGVFIGLLAGMFRVFGASAKGVSYAIITGNMITPLIDKYTCPKAFGVIRDKKKDRTETEPVQKQISEKYRAPLSVKLKAFCVMVCIALIAGIALGYVHLQTKDTILQRQKDDTYAAYLEVCDGATQFETLESDFDSILLSSNKDYGNIEIGDVLEAKDSNGNTIGSVVDVTTHDGYGGDIKLVVGADKNATITGVKILSINETAGLGMNAERDIVPQYEGKSGQLDLTKDGGEIQAISGATITSRAVTNAVNAALYIISQL